MDSVDDLELAKAAASAAAARATELFGDTDAGALRFKTSGYADPVGEADMAAETAARDLLARHRPDDPILGEEGGGAGGSERHWVIDPVDGTVNFLRGSRRWCSAVALIEAGEPQVTAIAAGADDKMCWARSGSGAWSEAGRMRCSDAGELSGAVIATYLNAARFDTVVRMKQLEGLLLGAATLRCAGSGGRDLADVAAGRLDAWALPDVDDWDWQPGALLVAEAGGVILESGPWRIAAATDALADQILAAVGA